MKAYRYYLGLILLAFGASLNAQENEVSADEYTNWTKSILEKLQPQTGAISLADGIATLNVPENFYYLSPTDTETVLVEVWGNPPGQQTLGMLFPAGVTPFDEHAWGVLIEYEEEGYVADDDANEINYGELLEQMQADAKAGNKARIEAGYEAIELVGWAAPPRYDADKHKLYWAKELKFGVAESNTLNYDIRVLGRKGVLVMSFIAGMNQLPEIERNLDAVLAMANFEAGNRYEDFDPSMDKVAAYGIGALVAGKVLAKTGFLAAALIFLKKFGVFILIGIAALFGKFFRRNKTA